MTPALVSLSSLAKSHACTIRLPGQCDEQSQVTEGSDFSRDVLPRISNSFIYYGISYQSRTSVAARTASSESGGMPRSHSRTSQPP